MLLSYLKRGFPKGEKLFIIGVSVTQNGHKNLEKFSKGPLFFLRSHFSFYFISIFLLKVDSDVF